MTNRIATVQAITLLCIAISIPCYSSTNYIATEIEFGEQVQAVSVADVNGDNLSDLIVSNWNEDFGRELWVYWQQAGGKFPAKPSRRIEVKRDIVAYGLADVRNEPGEELIFFTSLSIFSYSATHDSYANNLQKLADWIFVSAVPSQRSTPTLGRFTDRTGDGKIDMLLPGEETYGVFSITQSDSHNSNTVTTALLPKAQRRQEGSDNEGGVSVNMQDGIKIEVKRPSYFEGLVVERLNEKNKDEEENELSRYNTPGNLLMLERWVNTVETAQITRSPSLEFLYIDEDLELDDKDKKKQRLNIVSVENQKPTFLLQTIIDKRDEIKLFDFNNDGLMDILASRQVGSDDVTANIYLNREGRFNLDKADQVIKFTGYDVNFRLSDVNSDQRPDLIVGAYQISAVNALLEGALVRVSLIYPGNPNFTSGNEETVFKRRPDFRLDENFKAEDIKGLIQPVDFTVDIDADGNKDAVSIDKRGALIAKPMSKQLQLQDETAWEFVPRQFIQRVQNETLNRDKRPDFILHHQAGITVLVSQ